MVILWLFYGDLMGFHGDLMKPMDLRLNQGICCLVSFQKSSSVFVIMEPNGPLVAAFCY